MLGFRNPRRRVVRPVEGQESLVLVFQDTWILRLVNNPGLRHKARSIPAHDEYHAVFVGFKPRLLYLILEEKRAGRHPLP